MSGDIDTLEADYFKVACGAIAVYNSVEIFFLIGVTFHRYDTLYFWSMFACAMGIIWFAAGFLDLFYELYKPNSTVLRPLIILTLGWYGMVTGFALVMYSRLHLINVPKKYINYIRYFIIYNVIFSHFPTTVMTFGANITREKSWEDAYAIMEKLQMTMFCIQEVTLGMMYLHFTRKMTLNKKVTKLVRQTMFINVFVLFLDILMLGIEYAGLYAYQIMLKNVIYSLKLKCEFYLLNVLTKSLHQNDHRSNTEHENHASKRLAVGVVTPSAVEDVKSKDDAKSTAATNANDAA